MESPKLRLMCSYGGHIIPRPNNKSLSYTGGETRIVSIDRRTSFSSLITHLSKTLLNSRPFHLKYQIPNEDLDSLISVTTDEDLDNMIDEHDRVVGSTGRIRLFLFPVESYVGLLDPKSDSWFCDALKGTRILGEKKGGQESFVLETSSSFGSTGSSFSMTNLVSGESCGLGLFDRKVRVPSSASIVSSDNNSPGSGSSPPKVGQLQEQTNPSPPKAGLLEEQTNPSPPKAGLLEEQTLSTPTKAGQLQEQPLLSPQKAEQMKEQPLIQVSPDVPLIRTKSETSLETTVGVQNQTQNRISVPVYPLTQQPDGKQLQHQEPQLIQGGVHYRPQYAVNQMPMTSQYTVNQMPMTSYYPVYQMPMQQQHPVHFQPNQPYPIYLVPVRPAQYHNMPMQCAATDGSNYSFSCGLQLHTPAATNASNVAHNEMFRDQTAAEATTKVYRNIPSISVTPDSAASPKQKRCNEFDEEIVYSQIIKTQPPVPQYQPLTNGVPVMLSESSVQLQQNRANDQAALHPI